jgi:tetratricopeptide (TPR) repeat protein
VMVKQGQLAGARAAYTEVLALETASGSTALPTTRTSRAELALVERAWVDAATYAARAIEGFEAAGGKDNPELWRPLSALGRANAKLGKPAEARAALERAIAIGERVHLLPAELAATRDALAHLPP